MTGAAITQADKLTVKLKNRYVFMITAICDYQKMLPISDSSRVSL